MGYIITFLFGVVFGIMLTALLSANKKREDK